MCETSLRIVTLVLLTALSASVAGCAAGPDLFGQGQFAVNTPSVYTENKVFFVASDHETHSTAPAMVSDKRSLQQPYELQAGNFPPSEIVEHGDPLAVIVSGVRLPEDMEYRRDIAVILDVVTSARQGSQPLVVFYQRDVPGGQMLNFQNLLVYFDPQWDSSSPPYFRVRVVDVRSERNQRTRETLERAANFSSSVSGLIPHPIIPGVTTAIEAAGLVLGNAQNRILLDYQVQFYSIEQLRASGGSDLGTLRKGEWMVLGRPRGRDATFWSQNLERVMTS